MHSLFWPTILRYASFPKPRRSLGKLPLTFAQELDPPGHNSSVRDGYMPHLLSG